MGGSMGGSMMMAPMTRPSAPMAQGTAAPVANTAPDTAPLPQIKGICVVNSAPKEHVFTVESAAGARKLAHLAPGETLCVDSDGPGTVAVFLSEDAIEGCTRITQKDRPETLLHYYPFDRCLWASSNG